MTNDKTVRDGFLTTVLHQITSGDPPETKATYERLRSDGFSDNQAMSMISIALKNEMKQMIAESRGFDNARYLQLLENLPDLPE